MNIIKIMFFLLGLVIVGILGLIVLGMTLALLKFAFWLVVIGAIIAVLWKLFGGGSDAQTSGGEEQGRLQNAEMTLEEYKRKIESQLNEPRSGKDSS